MAHQVNGNLRGLAPSEIRRIEKLLHRRLDSDEFVSLDLAREIFQTASELRRRIGVLISREGDVKEVAVGTKDILYLPDLGRYRLGRGRLRRLRLIFSDLSSAPEARIPADIYTDLEKLRLDAVAGVKVQGNRTIMTYSYLLPTVEAGQPGTRTEHVSDLGLLRLDFAEFIASLEDEISVTPHGQRIAGRTSAVLVGVYEKQDRAAESSMAELAELAKTAGMHVADRIIQRREPDPKTLLGKGKLEELVLRCLRLGADMIVFDAELRPSQWRAIVNSTELKVIDRSMLILDIFGQHASSADGRLQVELAQLKYNLPRLVEFDAGLSRLTGGIGGRGPGETKLEIGRRRIRDRIGDLEKRIDKLGSQRQLKRARRQENRIPLVCILGYTNVGKSTLFNVLTGSQVLAEDKLFATLDPAQRRLVLPGPHEQAENELWKAPRMVILSDTVGFIRNLPAELANAFRATLEELHNASLLLHVVDASDPEIKQHKEAVDKILSEMKLKGVPRLTVLNKVDLVSPDDAQLLSREFEAVPISAASGEGIEGLIAEIRAAIDADPGSSIESELGLSDT